VFLARIDGTLTATVKHATLQACRFLIGQRLEADGTTSASRSWSSTASAHATGRR